MKCNYTRKRIIVSYTGKNYKIILLFKIQSIFYKKRQTKHPKINCETNGKEINISGMVYIEQMPRLER
jgi:hypothetical protein